MEQQLLSYCLLNVFLVLVCLGGTEPAFWSLALLLLPFAGALLREDARSGATTYKCSYHVPDTELEGEEQHGSAATGPCQPTLCQQAEQAADDAAAASLERIQQCLTPVRLAPCHTGRSAGVVSPASNSSVFVGQDKQGPFSRCLQRTESPRGVWELPLDGQLSPQRSTASELWSQASALSPLASSASSPLASPRQLSPQSTIRAPRFVITSRQVSLERQRPVSTAEDAPLALPNPAGSPLAAKVASGKWALNVGSDVPGNCCSEACKPVSTAVADVVAFYEARAWTS